MKLLIDHVARCDGMLVFGDISEQDGDAFAGRECMDVIPDVPVERLERSQMLFRYRLVEPGPDLRVYRIRKGLAEVCPHKVASSGQLLLCLLVKVSDVPAKIDDD